MSAALSTGDIYGLGYGRISGSKEQKDSALSIPSQEMHVREAMERDGAIFVDFQSDVLQGTRSDRKGYQYVLAVARRLCGEGKRVKIYVIRLDRFGRDKEERARAWKELSRLGVTIHAVRMGGDITDELLYDVDTMMAQHEVRRTSHRVRETNEFVRVRGFPIIGRRPWGYRIRDATDDERALGSGRRTLDLHPVEAPIVRHAWEMRAAGSSLGEIHRWVLGLTDHETGRRRLARQTLRRLFEAAVYVGRHDYPDDHPHAATPVLEREICRWPRLVSDEVYLAAAGAGAEQVRLPKQASGDYLLTGLVRCYRCGGRMTGGMTRASDVRTADGLVSRIRRRYVCQSSHLGRNVNGRPSGAPVPKACSTVITTATLDAAVLGQVSDALAGLADPEKRRLVERVWGEMRKRHGSATADHAAMRLAEAEKRRGTWTDARSTAYPDFKAGLITRREYDEIRDRAAGEIDAAEREIEASRARLAEGGSEAERVLPPLAVVLARMGEWGEVAGTDDVKRQRVLLAEMVERVEPVQVTRGRYRARIAWTERGAALRRVAGALKLAGGADGMVRVEAFACANTSTHTLQPAPRPAVPAHPRSATTTPPAARTPRAPAAPTLRPSARRPA